MHTLKTMKSFTDSHTLEQRMKSVHYNFLPHKKRIVSCKKRIERQRTVQEKYCIVRVTEIIVLRKHIAWMWRFFHVDVHNVSTCTTFDFLYTEYRK